MWSARTDAAPAGAAHPPLSWRSRLAPARALWLGPGGLWDHGPCGWPGRRTAAPAPRHHAGLAGWCQGRRGQAAALWLSGRWLHEVLVDARLPLADDMALLAYARGLLQHYHGDAAAAWPLAAWRAGGAQGVSALHGVPLADLQAQARQAGVALRSVQPAWTRALALARRRDPALNRADRARVLVVEGDQLGQIDLAAGRVVGMQQRRLAAPTWDALQAWAAADPVAPCAVLGHGLAGVPDPATARAAGLPWLRPPADAATAEGWWLAAATPTRAAA